MGGDGPTGGRPRRIGHTPGARCSGPGGRVAPPTVPPVVGPPPGGHHRPGRLGCLVGHPGGRAVAAKVVIDDAILHHRYRIGPFFLMGGVFALQFVFSGFALQCRPGELGHRLRPAQHRVLAPPGTRLRPPRPAPDRPAGLADHSDLVLIRESAHPAATGAGQPPAVPAGHRDHDPPFAALDRRGGPADADHVRAGLPHAPGRLPLEWEMQARMAEMVGAVETTR